MGLFLLFLCGRQHPISGKVRFQVVAAVEKETGAFRRWGLVRAIHGSSICPPHVYQTKVIEYMLRSISMISHRSKSYFYKAISSDDPEKGGIRGQGREGSMHSCFATHINDPRATAGQRHGESDWSYDKLYLMELEALKKDSIDMYLSATMCIIIMDPPYLGIHVHRVLDCSKYTWEWESSRDSGFCRKHAVAAMSPKDGHIKYAVPLRNLRELDRDFGNVECWSERACQ